MRFVWGGGRIGKGGGLGGMEDEDENREMGNDGVLMW